ncbi:MAG: hypothetical protein ACO1O1_15940 [Adhaeribacter sp.]
MKNLSLLFLLLLLTGATCDRTTEQLTPLYDKTWLHSNEEDGADFKIYRPNTYDFPPSRGRTGFALEQDGVFRLYTIAPTDGLEEHKGEWKSVKPHLLRISFPDSELIGFDLELISISAEMLKVRQNFSGKP